MKILLATGATVTTHMVLASALLRLSRQEVEQAIKRELEKNPALELVEPRATFRRDAIGDHARASDTERWQGHGSRSAGRYDNDDDFDPIESAPARESARDHLVSQARLLVPAANLATVTYLIESLDGHGFLRGTEGALARELGISRDRIAEGIAWLQQLEPPGIGARDLRECLLLQCAHLATLDVDCSAVRAVLSDAWDCFKEQRWDCVARQAKITRTRVGEVVEFIRANLHPFPLALLRGINDRTSPLMRPDLVVRPNAETNGARFSVALADGDTPRLRINELYRQAATERASGSLPLSPSERAWVCDAVENARRFMGALEGRRATLHRVATYVVAFQQPFFEHGSAHLRPLTRAAVALAVGLHESTVSRAVSEKVLEMPNGRLIEFDDLFDRSLAIKENIRQLLRTSPRELSDREIAAELHAQSLRIARRTVAKYRAQLGIPSVAARRRTNTRKETGVDNQPSTSGADSATPEWS